MRFLGRQKARLLQDVPGRSESEVFQQTTQLRLCGGDVDRMPELGEPANAYLRLVSVDFPRMQIDDGRLMLARVEVPDGAPGHRIRQETEVSASGDRQAPAENGYGGQREFGDAVGVGAARAVGNLHAVREARGAGDAIAVVDDGKDAGVIQKAGFPKD